MTAATLTSSRASGSRRSSRACSVPCTSVGTESSFGVDREHEPTVVPAQCPTLEQILQRLFEEVRVATRPHREQLRHRLGQLSAGDGRGKQPARVVGERPELDLPEAVRIALPGELAQAPGAVLALAAVEQHETDGRLLGHREQLTEERERGVVGGVQVLEDEADGGSGGETGDDLLEQLECLVLERLPGELADPRLVDRLEGQAEQARDERVRDLGVGAQESGKLRLQLEAQTCLGLPAGERQPVPQQVAHRPVRRVARVGDRAALDEADPVAVAVPHFRDEPRLPDSRLAHDRHDRAASLGQPFHRALEQAELVVASHEGVGARLAVALQHAEHPVRLDRLLEPAQLARTERLEVEALLDLELRGSADDGLAALDELLDARRHVHGVAERVVRILAVGLDDHGPRVDGDPGREIDGVGRLDLGRVTVERMLDGERRTNGPLGVVLVRYRSAEHRVELVADVLGHRALVPLDLGAHQPHHLVEQQLRALGPELLTDGRRANDVREEHGHDPPLASNHRHVPDCTGRPGSTSALHRAALRVRR